MVAQMSNQDFNNPMSDSEFIAQMASYSTLEAIKNMSQQNAVSYATGLVGKAVTVSDGTNYEMGIVDSVLVQNGSAQLLINGAAHDPKTVSDIVSDTLYMIMQSLVGTEVGWTDSTGEGKGIVKSGLVAGGEQFLMLDNDILYPLSSITLPNGDNAGEAVENAEENGETALDPENTVNPDGGDSETINPENVPANESDDEFTDLLDELGNEEIVVNSRAVNGSTAARYDLDVEAEISPRAEKQTEVVEIRGRGTRLDLAAGAYEENEILTMMRSADPSNLQAQNNSDVESVGTVSLSDYRAQLGISDDDFDDDITDDGDDIKSTSTDKVSDAERFDSPFENTVYTNTRPPITYGDDETYYRKYGYEYPSEAALADAYGTRMYDIRYITNTDITSRIDTSTIVGQTASGRGITEIGFSGKGRLGEVMTFADGTQRVEVIFRNGKSGWYNTTGKYTIDQITDGYPIPSDLTAFETDIRYYSKQNRDGSLDPQLQSFKDYIQTVGLDFSK
jgi:flagellar basal-body rod modification protein FlgD